MDYAEEASLGASLLEFSPSGQWPSVVQHVGINTENLALSRKYKLVKRCKNPKPCICAMPLLTYEDERTLECTDSNI